MKKPPWDRALHRFLPYCMILMAATCPSFLFAAIAFVLCYANLLVQEWNKDEEDENKKVIVDELIKIGERKP